MSMWNTTKTIIVCTAVIACISFSFRSHQQNESSFTSVDIGNIKAGTTTVLNEGKGIKMQGYGSMFGMHNSSDQGRFAYKKLKGDFDITIQVENITTSLESFAEGGLMVRKDLDPKSLMVANFVTNNNYKGESDQYTFMFRLIEGGSIEPYDQIIENFYGDHTFGTPSFGYSARGWSKTNLPVRPFPYVWLRLIRQGNKYTGYRRFGSKEDWGKWERMSEITADLGDEPYVGLALSANHHTLNTPYTKGNPESMSEIVISKIIGLQ